MPEALNLLYTLGDLGGIGPEIFFKFTKNLHRINEQEWLFNEQVKITLIDNPSEVAEIIKHIPQGKATEASGEHCYRILQKANKLLLDKRYDFLITGPVSKESLALAGHYYSGQTELLAALNNLRSSDVEMFFITEDFRVLLGTRHIPLSKVPAVLKENFPNVLRHGIEFLKDRLKISSPKIAIAGINPHAGEQGILGQEEISWMSDSISRFRSEYPELIITEALPADSLLAEAARLFLKKEPLPFDLYISAYHDQCLPLIKGISGYGAVNMTYGLPYTRISVDHGCAFDIAGKGLADHAALLACTNFCIRNSQLKQS